MLILERKTGQSVFIRTPGGEIEICVTDSTKGRVRLGFNAPSEIAILREEIVYNDEDQ